MKEIYYTDYPIIELGDKPGHQAPMREIRIVSFDGDKYCTIVVQEITTTIKMGYIYKNLTIEELLKYV